VKKDKIDEVSLSYLRFQKPRENRGNILVFFLIFLDLIGLIFLFGEPRIPVILWVGLIPVILIHIWAVQFIIAPYKYERLYYLFFGIYGVINTFVYFLVIQKLIYNNFEVNGVVPAFTGLLICIILLIVMNWINIRSLYSGTYSKLQKGEKTVNFSPFAAASGLGYVLAQFILSSFFVESIKILLIIGVFSLLSVATAFFSTNIHRYIYINRNMEKVKQIYPEFGLPKKLRKNA
jgi:hypothetical protein